MFKYYLGYWNLSLIKWVIVDVFPHHPGEDIRNKYKHYPINHLNLLSAYEVEDLKEKGLVRIP